jgi:hypothetical protein
MKCSCTAQGVYTCLEHTLLHAGSFGILSQHTMTPIAAILPQSKQEETLTKLLTLKRKIGSLKKNAREMAQLAISVLQQNLEKYLGKLKEIQCAISKMSKNIGLSKPININLIEKMDSLCSNLQSNNENDCKVIKSLDKLYSFESASNMTNLELNYKNEDCENALWFDHRSGPKLINLTTHKSTPFPCPIYNIAFPTCAKIGSDLYFVSGGRNASSTVCNETFILDIKNNKCNKLAFAYQMYLAGSICMNQVVHIFGGCPDQSSASKLCQAYNLRTNICTQIACLPQASYSNSAGEFNKAIYVSGYHMDKVFKFDGVAFSDSLILTANSQKLVCDGWIITDKTLYEMTTANASEWPNYSINISLAYYTPACLYKRQHFLYFCICPSYGSESRFARLNIHSKVIEPINVS